jgi:hypothetical protein
VKQVSDQEIDLALWTARRHHPLTPLEVCLLQLLAFYRFQDGAATLFGEHEGRTPDVRSSFGGLVGTGLLSGMALGYWLACGLLVPDPAPREPEPVDGTDMAQREHRRAEWLRILRADWHRRRAETRRLAQEVIAGRQTLIEAAARLRDMDNQRPDAEAHRRRLQFLPRGTTYERSLCEQIISMIEEMAAGEPYLAEVARRLAAGLADNPSREPERR